MEILKHLGENGRLLVFDQDADALANVPRDGRVVPVHGNFRFIHNYLRYAGYGSVDGILADLGVSSHQFDTGERGFSFRFDAPLDMRMNVRSQLNAEDIVNDYPEEELAKILHLYGEVEGSRRIADLICRARENARIRTTDDLSKAVESALPKIARSKYLAKIYQALRIEVNHEMASLEGLMEGAAKSLKPGGVFSVITYHSLEDRIVKNCFRSSLYRQVNKKPILPDEDEMEANPRARSAKLRIAQKI